jgi:TRAP-type C4-dicarboxylate transport system substrate-binding protein
MGMYDIMRKWHEKAGIHYLCNVCGGPSFLALFTNKVVKNPHEDFKGLRFRANPAVIEFYKNLGLTAVSMPYGEVYTAIERGVIDGYFFALTAVIRSGLHEVTKYMIDHPMGHGFIGILLNSNTWKRLSKDQQDLLTEIGIEMEVWADNWQRDFIERERNRLEEKGLKFTHFSPDDAEWYKKFYWDSRWAELMRDCPEHATKLKEMFYR